MARQNWWIIKFCLTEYINYQTDITGHISMHKSVQPWQEATNVVFKISTVTSQSRRGRNRHPCAMYTRKKRSTFTASPTLCPHARCVRYLELTKTARWHPSAASTRQRRWGLTDRQTIQYLLSHYFSIYCAVSLPPPQTELSDGISMMVGSNDRMQGIISQLEETCRAIEVSVQLLQSQATYSRSRRRLGACTNTPALTCKQPICVLVATTHSFYLSVRFGQRDWERRIIV